MPITERLTWSQVFDFLLDCRNEATGAKSRKLVNYPAINIIDKALVTLSKLKCGGHRPPDVVHLTRNKSIAIIWQNPTDYWRIEVDVDH